MPKFHANGAELYYELHGPENAPLLVLNNGILMSAAASWAHVWGNPEKKNPTGGDAYPAGSRTRLLLGEAQEFNTVMLGFLAKQPS